MPTFADAEEELQFFLGLQNPRTGACMDDGYPYMTFEGPTGNVLFTWRPSPSRPGSPCGCATRQVPLHEIRFSR